MVTFFGLSRLIKALVFYIDKFLSLTIVKQLHYFVNQKELIEPPSNFKEN